MANPIFYIKQGDSTPALEVILRDEDGVPVNLTGATVEFHMETLAGAIVINRAASVTDPTLGRVSVIWQAGDTANEGTYNAEFEVTFNSGAVQTFPNDRHMTVEVFEQIA